MRNFKKVIALVLALALTMSTFTVAFAAEKTSAEKLNGLGLLLDVKEADLGEELTRDIGLTMVLKNLGWTQEDANEAFADRPAANPFADVTQKWFQGFAILAVELEMAAGKTATSFAPKDVMTQKEYVVFMLRALGYEKDAAWANAADLAAAAGLVDAGNALDAASFTKADAADVMFRALMADMVGEGVTGTLADALIAIGMFTEAQAIEAGVKAAVPAALEVKSVSAVNLKEVDVEFNQIVDEKSAENKDNYSLANGTVDSVDLLEGGLVARITLVSAMTNQKANKISVKNVKAGDLKLVELKDFVFTPVDNTLPTVVSVTALGTKAIKVVFSEPIKTAAIGSFKLEGKAFYGSPSVNSREVVLKPYDSAALTVGDHVLTVSAVEDYFGLKSLSADYTFTVVEDKVAPTMSDVSATLETLTVIFSEDVDPDTVDYEKVYWKSGDTKIKATGKKSLAGNKYEFYFNAANKTLPSYETLIYVEGVKDYSGNAMTETTKLVRAVVDQTRPEVVEIKVNDAKDGFTIKFSKSIDLPGNNDVVKVTDKDGKVRNVLSIAYGTTNNSQDITKLNVTLYGKLPEGTNTVRVSGIKDKTTLSNTMLDYTEEIVVGDTTSPKYSSSSIAYDISNGVRRVIIAFNEKMDIATLANPANYTITFNGIQRTLPSDAILTVIQDTKAIMIDFPEKIGNSTVTFGTLLTNVRVMGVKDVAGNVLDNFFKDVTVSASKAITLADYDEDYLTYTAVMTSTKEIKVAFGEGIAKATMDDFTITGATLKSVKADGTNVVTLEIEELTTTSSAAITVVVKKDAEGIETVAGAKGVALVPVALTAKIWDKVAPKVKLPSGVTTLMAASDVIKLPFSEDLQDTVSATNIEGLLANDLIVTRLADNKILKAGVDYSTALNATDDSIIEITILAKDKDSKYSVAVVANANFIQDKSAAKANFVVAQDALLTGTAFDYAAPNAPVLAKLTINDLATPTADTLLGAIGAVEAGATVTVYSDITLTTSVGTAVAAADGSFAAINLTDLSAGPAITYYVTATDAASNESAGTAIVYTPAQ